MRQVVLPAGKVQLAEGNLADCLVDAVALAFFGGEDVVFDGSCSVAARQIEVAYGIVNLVEIVLVSAQSCHSLQAFHFAVDFSAFKHGALLDACVELGAICGT